MSVEQYSLVANDWLNLEFIINDLTQRVVGQELHPTSSPTFADVTMTGDLGITGDLDIGGTLTLDALTASRLVATDASKGLESSDLVVWVAGTTGQVTVTDESDGTITLSVPDPFVVPGKLTAGSFGSPLDVTNTRQYGFELHYSGNNYDVTALRARAQLVTTDTTATAQGALLQAANNDNVDAGVIQGALIEAIGKAPSNASTITDMRGCLVNTEWAALNTITNLKSLHVRTHSLNAAGAGSFGTGYGIYIENEAVGGNGQAYDAGIYFKGTNLSAGNKAFTYGIDFSGGTYGIADIQLSDGSVINTPDNRWGIGVSTGLDPRRGLTVSGDIDILHTAIESDDHAFELDVDAAGYGDVKAIDIDYITGAISTGEDEGIILLNIDEIAAAGGNVFGLEVLATEGAAASTTMVYGLKAGAVVAPIHQNSGTFEHPTIATNDTPSTNVPYMKDGNSANTTAIFIAQNDYILICSTAVFEEIEFILTTDSSGAGTKPKFEYSTAGSHQFTEFFPVDGTNGFRNTGVIAWDASDLTNHGLNTDTTPDTYCIKITRQRVNLTTPPVLGYAKVAATTEYIWDKDGNVNIKTLTVSTIAAESSDVDKFLVDSSGLIKYRTGAEVLADIGGSGSAHLHNTQTLEHDAVNSDGGAFNFTTSGTVTFSQSIASANYGAANKLTACATNAGALDFSAASKTLTVENNTVVSQDYSTDGSVKFAIVELEDASGVGLIIHSTSEHDDDGGRQCQIHFKGEQSGGEETTLARIRAHHEGAGDDEKGVLSFYVNDGDDGDSPSEGFRLTSDKNLTLADGASIGHVLGVKFTFNDATNNVITTGGTIGINQTTPAAAFNVSPLSVRTATYNPASGGTWVDVLVRNDKADAANIATGIAFLHEAAGAPTDNAMTGIACIKSDASDLGAHLAFITRPQGAVAVERMRILNTGAVNMGTLSATVVGPRLTIANNGAAVQIAAFFQNSEQSSDDVSIQIGSRTGEANDSLVVGFHTVGDGNVGNYGYMQVWGEANGAGLVIADGGKIGIKEIAPETLTEWTSTVPYLTLHNSTEEDGDGGRESRLIFKGEQSGGEETALFQFEASHDGVVDDQLGKGIWSVNTGAGLVEGIRLDSNLDTTFAGRIIATAGGIKTKLAVDSITIPPTDADLDTAFGDPTVVGPGFIGILNAAGAGINCYLCWTTGTAGEWFVERGTKVV